MFLIHFRNIQDPLRLNTGRAHSQKANKGAVESAVYKTSEGAGIKMFRQAVSGALGDALLWCQSHWKALQTHFVTSWISCMTTLPLCSTYKF